MGTLRALGHKENLFLRVVQQAGRDKVAAQLWRKRQQVLADVRSAQGTVLRRIGEGVNHYIVNHYSALVNDTPIPGVAELYAPTIVELQAIGDLDAGFQPVSLFSGLPYQVALSRTPAGCTPPACDISGLVYIRGAITDPSTGAPAPLGDALATLGGDGAYSDTLTPDRLSGPNGAWMTRNPLGNVASVLAMRVGYGTSGFSQFVRRDGSVPMEGDLNFQGTDGTRHNINNVQSVNADTVNATGDLTAGKDIRVKEDASVWGAVYAGGKIETSGFVSAHGGIYSDGDIESYGSITTKYESIFSGDHIVADRWIQANGRLVAGEYLQINGVAREGYYCQPTGLIGRSSTDGNLLVCQNDNIWRFPHGLNGRYVSLGAFHGGQDFYNASDQAIVVQVWGGNNNSHPGENCTNRFNLQGSVAGVGVVALAHNNNENTRKIGFISFMAPARTTYRIDSTPYACGDGLGDFSAVSFEFL